VDNSLVEGFDDGASLILFMAFLQINTFGSARVVGIRRGAVDHIT
jgi:hypothetical protein